MGSATVPARSWLLIEHPGPWPERVEQLTEPAPVAEAVRRAADAGVRAQLIRQPGRRRSGPPRHVYVGYSAGSIRTGDPAAAAGSREAAGATGDAGRGEAGGSRGAAGVAASAGVWLAAREFADPDDLGELGETGLAALARGERPYDQDDPGGSGWREVREPLLLVCTHGRRNTCCARSGGPLARALAGRFGAAVWETTHVGGDRFAANLVCLPHALYYGDLGPAEGVAAAAGYLRGEVVLDRLRGRAGRPEPAQAAEIFVRRHTGLLGVEAVTAESVTERSGGAAYEALVRAGDAQYQVTVLRATETADSCGQDCAEDLGSYILGELALLNEAALV